MKLSVLENSVQTMQTILRYLDLKRVSRKKKCYCVIACCDCSELKHEGLWVTAVTAAFSSSTEVMIQPQNRRMSFSVYIAALAVSDTYGVLIGKCEYSLQINKV